MDRVTRNRKVYAGAAFVAILLALGVGQAMLDHASAQAKQAPRFEVDPFWPKPMPNNWVMGMTIGIGVSSDDHVWVIHRGNDPGNLDRTELAVVKEGAPRVGECCNPAPPVLEFDAAGNLVGSWGGQPKDGSYDWPESNHGIVVDHKGFVWIGGNGGPDAHILKFTRDGKFVAQYGKKNARLKEGAPGAKPSFVANSTDMNNFGRVAKIFIDPKANEGYVADGYLNKRVAVIDLDSGKIKRFWGAYGKPPTDDPLGPYDPAAPVAQAVPHPGALRRDVERRLRLRVRPSERPRPDLHPRGQVREGSLRGEGDARRRLGVGHRLLEGPGPEVPLHGRRRQRARARLRPSVDGRALQLRLRRPPARHVPGRAQHRHRLEGQHLHDRDLHGQAPAEVHPQGR